MNKQNPEKKPASEKKAGASTTVTVVQEPKPQAEKQEKPKPDPKTDTSPPKTTNYHKPVAVLSVAVIVALGMIYREPLQTLAKEQKWLEKFSHGDQRPVLGNEVTTTNDKTPTTVEPLPVPVFNQPETASEPSTPAEDKPAALEDSEALSEPATPATPPATVEATTHNDIASLREQIARHSQQIATLEARLAGMESRPTANAAAAPTPTNTAAPTPSTPQGMQRITILGGGLAEQNREKLTLLETNITQLKEQLHTTRQTAELRLSLMHLLWQLDLKATSGKPFHSEVEQFRHAMAGLDESRAAPLRQSLDKLGTISKTGVPTVYALQARFNDQASTILYEARTDQAGDRFQDKALHALSGLVRIRKIESSGAVEDDVAEHTIRKAEAALKAGDIILAVQTIQQLADAGSSTALQWVEAAQSRAMTDQAIANLRNTLMESGPTPPSHTEEAS